jgi:dihydroorotate dehydrogenase electron transfer subunit
MEQPDATTSVCAVDACIASSETICRQHVVLEFTLPTFPSSAPGQFLQLLCRDARDADLGVQSWPTDGFPSLPAEDLAGGEPFLRRPFSIADHWGGADGLAHLRVISRAVGTGTRWLERLRPGNTLNLTGPLGRGFRIPPAETALLLIGGGVGIPPLLYFARRLHELGRTNVTMLVGATSRALLPLRLTAEPAADATPTVCVELPGEAPFPTIVTTNDGTAGVRGVATDALQAWDARRGDKQQPTLICACGPEAMLRAVARITAQRGWACQLCIERNMGCGLGTCLSCVVRVRDAARETGWRWGLACTDGPVFPRDDLLDYSQDAGA